MSSLLESEAAGFAEDSVLSPEQARRLIDSPQSDQLDALRDELPGIEDRLMRRVEALADEARSDGLWMICGHDPDFPPEFTHLEDTPIMLYGLGSSRVLTDLSELHPGVAIVGARRASAYGRDVAYQFGRDLAAAGMTVVSGMALGVDGAAHRGALAARGRTIAVLAGGPDRPYPPSHRRLYEQLLAEGAVISERPPGARARRWGFPARNRLVAALSRRTIFVEGTRSSGARHTVDFARQLGQDPLAVPGPITSPLSEGPNAIIAEASSYAVISAEGVLDRVFGTDGQPPLPGIEPQGRPAPTAELDPVAVSVLACIRSGDVTPEAIAVTVSELEPRDISIALGELELAGRVERDRLGGYRVARDPSGAG